MITLYDYHRSSACYRVRIALQLKGLTYDKKTIHLINDGGEQHHATYHEINPQELVPSLAIDGQRIHQSLAIIDYLEERFPMPPLLPSTLLEKTQVRALALLIACDIHPLNNLRVLNRLKSQFQANKEQVMDWYHHWLTLGFSALEEKLQTMQRTKPVCYGDSPGLADLCLIPQVYNAERFHFNLDKYPLIQEINHYCLSIPAFQEAAPDKTT